MYIGKINKSDWNVIQSKPGISLADPWSEPNWHIARQVSKEPNKWEYLDKEGNTVSEPVFFPFREANSILKGTGVDFDGREQPFTNKNELAYWLKVNCEKCSKKSGLPHCQVKAKICYGFADSGNYDSNLKKSGFEGKYPWQCKEIEKV